MNVSAVRQLPDKMPVIGFAGKVGYCKKVEVAPSQYDDAGVRKLSFVIEEGSEKIWVNVFRPDLDDYAGLEVEISAYENKKGGLSGAKVSRYTDKKGVEQVSVTATGGAIKVTSGTPKASEPEEEPSREVANNDNGVEKVNDNEMAARLLNYYRFFALNGVPEANAGPLASTMLIALNQNKCSAVAKEASQQLSKYIYK